jgi:thiol-disulfide isomerase/thioredoxin
MKNKPLTLFGITTGAVILFLSLLTLNPDAKAFMLNNFMPSCLVNANVAAAGPAAAKPAAPETAGGEITAAEVPLAPSVVFKDGQGKTIDISKQKGKVLFINFWATWCPPCLAEMPSIAKLKQQLNSKDMLFLMVDVDKNYRKSQKFMDKNQYHLPVYLPAGEIPADFLSGAIPTTVIIDKAGRVVARQEGGANYASPEAVKFFAGLLQQ